MHTPTRPRPRRRAAALGMLAAALALAPLAVPPATAHPAADPPSSAAAAAARPAPAPDGSAVDPIAHDPTIIKEGDWYYVVITGDAGADDTYLPMKRSRDLVTWEELGPVFTTPPQWVLDAIGVTTDDLRDLWAPEITFADGEYRLYYAASRFGTNTSVIGLASTPTLDPDDPRHGWTDEGLVLRSTTTDVSNAIDPDVTVDEDGQAWLAWGSFWSGLWIRPIDDATGKPVEGAAPTHLVDRQWAPNAVEAPALVRHGGFWYLFASFDYCCRGANSEYRTVVGRAASITGPYVDRSGLPLLAGGGTELLRGYGEFVGPGGGDVYVDGDRTLYVHHYYDADDEYVPRLSVRDVAWDEQGWPSFGDPLTGSREVGHGPAYLSLVTPDGSGAVGTVPGGPAAPLCGYEGADVRLLSPSGSPCQQWRVEPRGEGWSSLRNLHTNKVLEAAGCNAAVGADVAQWGWLANDCQRFRLRPATDGWVTVEARIAADRVLDAGATCAAGNDVTLWSGRVDRCQTFRLQPHGDVLIVSAATGEPVADRSARKAAAAAAGWRFEHTSAGYLRVTAGGTVDLPVRGCVRATVRAQDRSGGPDACAEWRLVPMDDGTFGLQDRATGLAVGRTVHDRLELQSPTGEQGQRFRLVQP